MALYKTMWDDAPKFDTLLNAFIVDETSVIRFLICWAVSKLCASIWELVWKFRDGRAFFYKVKST